MTLRLNKPTERELAIAEILRQHPTEGLAPRDQDRVRHLIHLEMMEEILPIEVSIERSETEN
jgi:hypothetical protein